MSLLDALVKTAGDVLGSHEGGSQGVLDVVRGMFDSHGGLEGLVGKLREAGLGEQVDSWISMGRNLPVSAQDIAGALGNGPLAEMARKLGIDPHEAAGHLADLIPKAIDHLTPDGTLPD
jgi:uncharacterized protein YidB (DUF937 family)